MFTKAPLLLFIVYMLTHLNHLEIHAQTQLKVGGYLQTWLILNQHQETADGDQDTWGYRIRRARLTAQADITDMFRVDSWVEFSGAQPQLLDFILDIRISPEFNLRLGQFRPAGQMYKTGMLSSSRLTFYERPAIASRLSSIMGYDAFRDIGIQAMGSSGPLWYGFHILNGMGRFTQAGTNITSRDFGGGLYGGRIDINPLDGLIFGGHFSMNKQSNVVRDGSAPYDIDRISYSIRIVTDDLGIPGLFSQLEAGGGRVDDTQRFDFSGWYLQAGYRINPSWSVLARYDYYSENPETGPAIEEDNLTLGVIYYWMQNNREIIRAGANFAIGDSEPGAFARQIFLLWFQIRFIP